MTVDGSLLQQYRIRALARGVVRATVKSGREAADVHDYLDWLEAMKSDKQISLRLPQEFLDRAKTLTGVLREDRQYKYVPRLESSFVLRLAIEIGLEALEEKHASPDYTEQE